MQRVIASSHVSSRVRRRSACTALAFAALFSAVSFALPAFTPVASAQADPVGAAHDRLARAQADADAAQARYDQAVAERGNRRRRSTT
jgi:hypothetical protein